MTQLNVVTIILVSPDNCYDNTLNNQRENSVSYYFKIYFIVVKIIY